ncbi:MAG: type II secretion system F family protein [Acidimicrobiia bacterium]
MTVVVAAVLGLLLLAGVPFGYVAAGAVFVISPPVGLVVAAGAAVWEVTRVRRQKSTTPSDEAALLRELAASVQAGETLRQAVVGSLSPLVGPSTRRLCRSGVPMSEIGREFLPKLPMAGVEFAVVAELSETTGAAAGRALTVLADESDNAAQHAREQRVSVAQSKYSAVVVGIVPLAAAVALVMTRGVPEPGGTLIIAPMIVGAAMMAIGSGVIFLMANRAAS